MLRRGGAPATSAQVTERAGRAFTAATRGDLAALTHDLPALPPPAPAPARDQRNLLVALALALVTIAALGIVLALYRP